MPRCFLLLDSTHDTIVWIAMVENESLGIWAALLNKKRILQVSSTIAELKNGLDIDGASPRCSWWCSKSGYVTGTAVIWFYHLCVENYPSPDMCLARDRIAIALPFCIAMFRRCFNQSVSLFCPVFSAIDFINENVIIYGDKPTFK